MKLFTPEFLVLMILNKVITGAMQLSVTFAKNGKNWAFSTILESKATSGPKKLLKLTN